MKIYFDNPEYDGQFLRALDHGPLGAQIGEAWAIAAQIEAGGAASWYNTWSSYADRLYQVAVKSRAAEHRVSGRNAFLRASNYYRAAYIFMFTRYNALKNTCSLRRTKVLASTAKRAHARYFSRGCLTGSTRSWTDERLTAAVHF